MQLKSRIDHIILYWYILTRYSFQTDFANHFRCNKEQLVCWNWWMIYTYIWAAKYIRFLDMSYIASFNIQEKCYIIKKYFNPFELNPWNWCLFDIWYSCLLYVSLLYQISNSTQMFSGNMGILRYCFMSFAYWIFEVC